MIYIFALLLQINLKAWCRTTQNNSIDLALRSHLIIVIAVLLHRSVTSWLCAVYMEKVESMVDIKSHSRQTRKTWFYCFMDNLMFWCFSQTLSCENNKSSFFSFFLLLDNHLPALHSKTHRNSSLNICSCSPSFCPKKKKY